MAKGPIDQFEDTIVDSLEQYQENLEEATEMSWWVILVWGAFVVLAWIVVLFLMAVL